MFWSFKTGPTLRFQLRMYKREYSYIARDLTRFAPRNDGTYFVCTVFAPHSNHLKASPWLRLFTYAQMSSNV